MSAHQPRGDSKAPVGFGRRRSIERNVFRVSLGIALFSLRCERVVGIEAHEFADSSDPGNLAGSSGASSARGGSAAELGGSAGAFSETTDGEAAAGGGRGAGVDGPAPTVTRFEPEQASYGVDPFAPIVIDFSEPMDTVSVEVAYSQNPGTPSFEWVDADTRLIVSPGLDRPVAKWNDDERPGSDDALAVDFGVGTRARDKSGNRMRDGFASRFYLERRVEHRLSPCLGLSGTASAVGFEAAAPSAGSCDEPSDDAALDLAAGYRDGHEVVAVLSYWLGDLASDAVLESANLIFDLAGAVGELPTQFGALLLEQTVFGTESALAYQVETLRSLGVLATAGTSYPQRAIKDVTASVAELLALEDRGAALLQFRVRFSQVNPPVAAARAFARLDGNDTAAPTLIVTYRCARCS